MTKTIQIGDWVSFVRDGRVVYGKVEYLTRSVMGRSAVTTEGAVGTQYVLEARRDAVLVQNDEE